MKFIHTADWHLGNTMHDIDRTGESEAFLSWLKNEIVVSGAQALVIAGDIFDVVNPSNCAKSQYYRFLASLHGTCCTNVVVVGGNHDSGALLDAPAELLEALNMKVVGSINNRCIDDLVVELKNDAGEVIGLCCAVPFMRDAELENFYKRNTVVGDAIAAGNATIAAGDAAEVANGNATTAAGDASTVAAVNATAAPENSDSKLLEKLYADVYNSAVKRRGERNIPIIATGHLYAADLSGRDTPVATPANATAIADENATAIADGNAAVLAAANATAIADGNAAVLAATNATATAFATAAPNRTEAALTTATAFADENATAIADGNATALAAANATATAFATAAPNRTEATPATATAIATAIADGNAAVLAATNATATAIATAAPNRTEAALATAFADENATAFADGNATAHTTANATATAFADGNAAALTAANATATAFATAAPNRTEAALTTATAFADGNAAVLAATNATAIANATAASNRTEAALATATAFADENATAIADGNAAVLVAANATATAFATAAPNRTEAAIATTFADENATAIADGNATAIADGNAAVLAATNATAIATAAPNRTEATPANATAFATAAPNRTKAALTTATAFADENATAFADGNAAALAATPATATAFADENATAHTASPATPAQNSARHDDGVRDVVGTLGNVEADAFPSELDYVALGHIHYATMVAKNPKVRYSGSPFVMGFDEARCKHCVLAVEANPGATPQIEKIIVPRTVRYEQFEGDVATLRQSLRNLEAELLKEPAETYVDILLTSGDFVNLSDALENEEAGKHFMVKRHRIGRNILKDGAARFSDVVESTKQYTKEDYFKMLIASKIEENVDSEKVVGLFDKFISLFNEAVEKAHENG